MKYIQVARDPKTKQIIPFKTYKAAKYTYGTHKSMTKFG